MQTFTFLQLQFKTSTSDLRCHQKAALFRTLVGWCCCSGSSCLLSDKQLDPSGHCHHIEFSSVFGGKPILKIKVVLLEKYLSLFILLSFIVLSQKLQAMQFVKDDGPTVSLNELGGCRSHHATNISLDWWMAAHVLELNQ